MTTYNLHSKSKAAISLAIEPRPRTSQRQRIISIKCWSKYLENLLWVGFSILLTRRFNLLWRLTGLLVQFFRPWISTLALACIRDEIGFCGGVIVLLKAFPRRASPEGQKWVCQENYRTIICHLDDSRAIFARYVLGNPHGLYLRDCRS